MRLAPTRLSVFAATALVALLSMETGAFVISSQRSHMTASSTSLAEQKKAGSFFNQVPDNNSNSNSNGDSNKNDDNASDAINKADLPFQSTDIDASWSNLVQQRKSSKALQPSTIQGVPTRQAGQGFSTKAQRITPLGDAKPFVGIGPPLNDITKPEYDDQGYTLYADEKTGKKSRVFEALVDYPCKFTLKIVGANEGTFVQDIVAVVAESCQVEVEKVEHSTRAHGKWTSVTVQAPVQSAEMLYQLYENVDRDPRVRFKF
jgi:putative lipoic acid-binding regulatory protein